MSRREPCHDYLLFEAKIKIGQKNPLSLMCRVFELLLTGLTIQF
ncbi:hypothetical protein [Bartonella sp. M0283]|nr:hypothetical protein [Bartonella sp. M0283]